MSSENSNPKYPLQTLSKALEILNYIKDCPSSDGVTLNTLSNDLKISKSSAHRILDTLLSFNFVEKNNSGIIKYRLSWAAYNVGISVPKYHTLNSSNYALLIENLSKELKRTVTLSIPNKYYSITMYRVDYENAHPRTYIGQQNPLYVTASGKLFMLNFTQEEIRNYFNNTEIKKYTPNTILNFIEFLDELNLIYSKGYSVDNCEFDEVTACVAMPIKDYTRNTVAAISVADSPENMTENHIQEIIPKLKETCDTLSQYLGF